MTLRTEREEHSTPWNGTARFVIVLIMLFGLILLLMGRVALAAVFTVYGVILVESRIALRQYIHGFPGASILVTVIRAAFFFLPLPLLGFPPLNPLSWGVPVGIVCGLLLQVWQWRNLQFILSNDFLAILPPLSPEEKFNQALPPILSAIAQEYFYRGALLYALGRSIGPWAIAVSALLFTCEHIMHVHSRRRFDQYDFILQTLLGLSFSTIFYFSASLSGCILGHIVYNSVSVLQTVRRKSK